MDTEHVRLLLRRSESDTLDFKRDQYPFAAATDDEKSELLKDIIAFANGWKESDAYIVIGVPEENGRALGPVGAAPLQDADVQQFVGSKVNRPLAFHIENVTCDGFDLTIIRIEQHQQRPLFLKKRYGKLEANTVYIRRGSSTDKADPEEIAEMGRDDARISATTKTSDMTVEFEHVLQILEDRNPFGQLSSAVRREPREVEWLTIFLRNTGSEIAHYVKAELQLPKNLLWDYAPRPLQIPKSKSELRNEPFQVSNHLRPPRPTEMSPAMPQQWYPILPAERLEVSSYRVFPRDMFVQLSVGIAWKGQADSSAVRSGAVQYNDIPVVDER